MRGGGTHCSGFSSSPAGPSGVNPASRQPPHFRAWQGILMLLPDRVIDWDCCPPPWFPRFIADHLPCALRGSWTEHGWGGAAAACPTRFSRSGQGGRLEADRLGPGGSCFSSSGYCISFSTFKLCGESAAKGARTFLSAKASADPRGSLAAHPMFRRRPWLADRNIRAPFCAFASPMPLHCRGLLVLTRAIHSAISRAACGHAAYKFL